MSLRIRILLFLFLFGLVPLILAVLINLPLVLERVDLFYRHAFLQNLRADFSDLDQHLASRDASVRLLSRLPEPGVLVGGGQDLEPGEIDVARARYIQWVNRILGEERDITEILFLDQDGVVRFWLERDAQTGVWEPTAAQPGPVPVDQVALLLSGRVGNVVLSPLRIDLETADPARMFTLQLLGPIPSGVQGEAPIGVVAITLDIVGLVKRDPKTLWVHDDGSYLRLPGITAREGSAFDEFPGLGDDFASNRIVLWEGADRRAIWVPMFRTSDGRTLWVGRPVDDRPLREFRTEIVLRVLVMVLVLIVLQFVVARWITRRAGHFGRDLTEGVQRTLESDQPVVFAWDGPPEVRRLAADLTRLSQTHASHTRNLRAHARELEATNRYKSQFLANVSHELRTPLNSILLLSKLLAAKTGRLDEESLRQADVIHKAGSDLQALIDNILDLSRIEAGRLELHVEEADVGELLDDLQTLMAPQFDAKGLTFRVEKDADAPPRVRTDVDKVRQVLKNFLANAVKFTAEGRVTLRAAAAPAPYTLALSVHDTGIGIPPGKQGVVFEAFQQADGSTSRRYGGTGLGLAISRQLAALVGGEIRLVSEAGEGAEFTLLLPAETCPEAGRPATAPAPSPSEPDELAAPVPEHLAGRQVLLMEPDVRQQLALSGMLRGLGTRLHLADDLDEALETLDEVGRVDLVLIDVAMPGEGACATIQRLREALGDDLVVIGLVSAPSSAAAETCVAVGADDAVLLPCSVTALAEVLSRHLGEPVEHRDK